MLEDTWQMDFPRRPEMPDGLFPGINVGLPMWDNYPVFPTKPKKEEKVGLAEAITSSILSTGRIELQRKLFCSIQLVIFGIKLNCKFQCLSTLRLWTQFVAVDWWRGLDYWSCSCFGGQVCSTLT